MNEFIEKLIGRLEEEKKYCSYHPKVRDEAMDKAISIINELAEEYKGGWIPCSERLPEVKKEVLIIADDNYMCVGHLVNGGFSVHDGEGLIDLKHILAWQPLPEPYKEHERVDRS